MYQNPIICPAAPLTDRSMAGGPQAAARAPPRLLCLPVLALLAVASIYFVFMLLGMQLWGDSHGTGRIISQSHEHMPRSTSFLQTVAASEELGTEQEEQQSLQCGRAWSPVPSLRELLPYSTPRDVSYHPPVFPGSGFLFTTIRGELHEIHTAVSDLVVIARLLNATIILPKIQGSVSVKSGGPKVESFSYLYDEEHFTTTLKNDVRVVSILPKQFRSRARLQKQTVKTPTRFSSVQYYLDEVLPALAAHGACGLVFSDGGGLQSLLPAELVEYQRLRCRVAFHALRFRREIQDLGVQLVRRLEAHGRPYVVVHLGLERDVLARHGCAELFQDLQTQSIQLQRNHFLTIGKGVGELDIDSQKQRHRGLCPLMPEEVGLLLESYGFCNNTRIYLTGTETTGGQRLLLYLRSMYANLEDRFTLSTVRERFKIQPAKRKKRKILISATGTYGSAFATLWKKLLLRRTENGPPVRSSHKGWWRTDGDCESHTEDYFASAPAEEEAKDIQLLLAALDYMVSLEANTFFPGFDKDRHGLPDFARLIMGHRLYQSASLKTFRPNRSALVALLDAYPDERAHNVIDWRLSARRLLMESLVRPETASQIAKSEIFLSHPMPECACREGESNNSRRLKPDEGLVWEGVSACPAWMVSKF